MKISRKNLLTLSFGLVWTVAVALGLRALLNYETTPGRAGIIALQWQSGSRIERAHDRPTLVMFAHPRCPCTRASMSELAQIMAELQGKVSAYVVFVEPKNVGTDWTDTGLKRAAAAIPGVTIAIDIDGVEAHRFGAETSGHTLLFDRTGHLLFSGGITQSRGHAGDNVGESDVISLVNNPRAGRTQTMVFGCSLARAPNTGMTAACTK